MIAAYAACANVSLAAKAAGITSHSHYRWMREEEPYRRRWEEMLDQAAQILEDEAVRRAVQGVKRPFLYKGQPVKVGRRILYEHLYSDTLLIALLKRFRPALYRDHVTAEVTGTIEIAERLQAARRRVIAMERNDTGTAAG